MLRIGDDSHCTHGFDVLAHGSYGSVSRLGSLRRVLSDMVLEAASSHLQRVSFAIAPFQGWRCAEASSCEHHALQQLATPNSSDEIYR